MPFVHQPRRRLERGYNSFQFLQNWKELYSFIAGNINERQAQIIRMYIDNPNEVLTVKDVQANFLITPTTAKSDLIGLVQRGLLNEISFNKVKKGYTKGDNFDESIKQIKL